MKEEIKEISETLFEVGSYSVKIQTKQGRRILLCNCQNHTRFCIENAYCSHKEKVLRYIALKPIKSKIEHLKDEYDTFKKLKLPINNLMYDDYLDQIFRLFNLKCTVKKNT